MSRPTVHDIAKLAGVSLATVDRVLNARSGVRQKTIARVQEAVVQLGYVRDVAAANLARQRHYRLQFVLPEPSNAFLRTVHEAIDHVQQSAIFERTQIKVTSVPAHDPHAIAHRLHQIDSQAVDGLAIMAAETPQVRDALKGLANTGVAIAAFGSDLPSTARHRFIGLDNIAAGRTAGRLMGRFLPISAAKIMVVAGSMMARNHVERRLGFDSVIAADYPHLEVLGSIEGWDDAETVATLVEAALRRDDAIAGIYSIGAGNSGLVQALQRRASRTLPVVIAHELTPLAREALETGLFDAVISQNIGHVVRSAVRVLKAISDGQPINSAQEQIRIEIMLKENLHAL